MVNNCNSPPPLPWVGGTNAGVGGAMQIQAWPGGCGWGQCRCGCGQTGIEIPWVGGASKDVGKVIQFWVWLDWCGRGQSTCGWDHTGVIMVRLMWMGHGCHGWAGPCRYWCGGLCRRGHGCHELVGPVQKWMDEITGHHWPDHSGQHSFPAKDARAPPPGITSQSHED